MKFTKKTSLGTIQKRYKRFLSDITLDSGEQINAHVPNTGSMKECWGPDWKVLVTHADDPKRKLQYTLEMTHNGSSWICVNTGLTNKLVHEALNDGVIEELIGYEEVKPEKKYKESRIDFFLSSHGSKEDCYVEVKNVTLIDGEKALFPDAVSTRGQKHLRDLMEIKEQGLRACMLYVINRTDANTFSPAKDIDPTYAQLLVEAQSKGVEILAYQCSLNEEEIVLNNPIEVVL